MQYASFTIESFIGLSTFRWHERLCPPSRWRDFNRSVFIVPCLGNSKSDTPKAANALREDKADVAICWDGGRYLRPLSNYSQ